MSQVSSVTVISAERHERFFQMLKDLWAYRELFVSFFERDLKVRYKQTALGAVWVVLQPLFLSGAYSIILGKLAGMPTDGLPPVLFYFAANVPWTGFSREITGAAMSVEGNANLVTKIYFPRIIVPAAFVCSSMVDFLVGWTILAIAAISLGYWHWSLVAITPLLMLIQGAIGLGIGAILAALNAQYRDVKNVIGFLVQLMMLATPVFYPISTLAEKVSPHAAALVLTLNPMAVVIVTYRDCLRGLALNWSLIGIALVSSLLVLFVGVWFFRKRETHFADVL